MINIDFLVAGCNTRCRHCYVNGGPGPAMAVDDALLCIERLDSLAAHLTGEVSFTLDHEPMNHPHIDKILHAASKTRHIQNFHHGMTTGLGLIRRQDKKAVVQSYFDCGYRDFGITIHGNAEHHDEITRRKGAYQAAVAAAEFLKAEGADLNISLMLNRFFAEDADAVTALLRSLRPGCIFLALPIYTPHCHMQDFEPYRVTMKDVEQITSYLSEWGQDADKVVNNARESTAEEAIKRLNGGVDLPDLFREPQDELYLSLHPDCKLYVGNSGVETHCLGDLRKMDLASAAKAIAQLPGNRDYGAFYNADELPSTDQLINSLTSLPQNKVYGDFPSVVYRGLAGLNIPTKLMEGTASPLGPAAV